jgi:hypothetical protein
MEELSILHVGFQGSNNSIVSLGNNTGSIDRSDTLSDLYQEVSQLTAPALLSPRVKTIVNNLHTKHQGFPTLIPPLSDLDAPSSYPGTSLRPPLPLAKPRTQVPEQSSNAQLQNIDHHRLAGCSVPPWKKGT